jgi:hypothetical protein
MGTLSEDVEKAATWIAGALTSSGYRADFSIESLQDIDRFFDEHSRDGEAVPGGLLGEQLGQRVFSIGSYVGETIRRAYGGAWSCDDSDPEGELNVAIRFPSGELIWPVQRVMKRFRNGPEDGIYSYGVLVAAGKRPIPTTTSSEAIPPIVLRPLVKPTVRPWWKFW